MYIRYYQDDSLNEITRDLFEERLLETIKAGRLFIVKGIAKDAFLLTTGDIVYDGITDEKAGRLYANVINQIDNAISHA